MPLYPHQLRVRELLQAGRNVILQAPTGAGKTRAAIEPFLHSANLARYGDGGFLPSKLIYSVPMRVLAKQFEVEWGKSLEKFNTKKRLELKKSIQTGDMPHDPELAKNLIFATIDQTLSSFLMAPYGLSRGRANLNLGALLTSYLVFDEFHLYDPDSTLPTTLQMLRMLKGITPFVLMTATFSDVLVRELAHKLDAEVVGLDADDRTAFATLRSQRKTRRYHARREPLTPGAVLEAHRGRSIVICNTVARARAMARRLQAQAAGNTEVILLHSQFLREDRDRIEDDLRRQFGKGGSESGSVIVVATQAIEVGVDITCTAMHTELAPANAIIQRAGRCARYEGDTGDVYVYRHTIKEDSEEIDLYENPLPYGNKQQQQMQATFEVLSYATGEALDFEGEQTVIDQVHGEADREVLSALDADSAGHRRSMFAAMRGDEANVGDLVRNVIAQPVTMHAEPEANKVMQNPHRLPTFSLHPGTLRGYVASWLHTWNNLPDGPDTPDWAVKYLHKIEGDEGSLTFADMHTWERVERPSDIPYGTLVVVHPALASYDDTWGFQPGVGGGWKEDLDLRHEKKSYTPHTYQLETYAEHIGFVYEAAFEGRPDEGHTAYWQELAWAAHRLAERLGITYEQMRRAAELTVLLHDVGKLSRGWQQWVQDYQAAIGQPADPNTAYAHTDNTTERHRQIEKGMRRRPPHAVQSAVASVQVIAQELPETLRQPVFTAISRHHGAHTSDYKPFYLVETGTSEVAGTLGQKDISLLDAKRVSKISDQMFVSPKDDAIDAFFAYTLLARLLRRSDTRGTIWNSPTKGGNKSE